MSSFDQPMPPYNASDPTATFMGTSCLDFLLIELVPMAYRIANELQEASDEGSGSGSGSKNNEGAGSVSTSAGTMSTAPGPASSAAGRTGKLDEEEEREAVFFRLEGLGYRVGLGLVERFSRDRPRFTDTLDAIKFVCKDLWMLVFKKQIDNLKTNHRGVYVLTDHAFRPLSRMSTDAGGQAVARAQPFLWFPCGILRGALAAMGISATVQAETSELPAAVFQIKTVPAAPK
ncbi:BET3 family protein [Hypoxylon argillaceum]|nr:BET3 family protein [Hypoxylon argillaceum]KAI1155951.1 BET3 family protein [Nemania diffusa]